MNYDFTIGLLIGLSILFPTEYLLINFIYLKNIDSFCDIILTKKNKDRLRKYFDRK